MAKESVAIIKDKLNVNRVIEVLNKALAEEWLAFYQYWIGAAVLKGAMRGDIQREFEQHALEEFGHAKLLVDRIIQLDGTPLLHPQRWFEYTGCAYEEPDSDFEVTRLLVQNTASERCAIRRYQEIASITDGKDFTTCDLAKRILADEQAHEQELQDFLDDVRMLYRETSLYE